jgi:uncharacterized protein
MFHKTIFTNLIIYILRILIYEKDTIYFMKEVNDEKLNRYFDVTRRALAKVKLGKKRDIQWKETYTDFLDMATRYFEDAQFFKNQNDYINAFAALNYAHGWLDAGARLGIFDVGGDNILFTVDKDMFKDG